MRKYNKKERYADSLSFSERKPTALIEYLKKFIFYPVVILLIKLGITANMVSCISALIGFISAIYLWFDYKVAAILLLISFFTDGTDGSLARATHKNDKQGAIMDCFMDQITISATTIGFISIGLLDPIIGSLYLLSYPIVVIFSSLRNIIGKPAIYVLRPRIIVYAAFWLYTITSFNSMNYVVSPLSLILLFQVTKDFYFLRGHLRD